MKKNVGFTLIELVVVIVILAILGVTAAPKFLNLSTEARIANLKGLEGAIRSAVTMGHLKYQLTGCISTPGNECDVEENSQGYPDASSDGILKLLEDFDNSGWFYAKPPGNNNILAISQVQGQFSTNQYTNIIRTGCFFLYIANNGEGEQPTFNSVTEGC